jgi:hypothetical protein
MGLHEFNWVFGSSKHSQPNADALHDRCTSAGAEGEMQSTLVWHWKTQRPVSDVSQTKFPPGGQSVSEVHGHVERFDKVHGLPDGGGNGGGTGGGEPQPPPGLAQDTNTQPSTALNRNPLPLIELPPQNGRRRLQLEDHFCFRAVERTDEPV